MWAARSTLAGIFCARDRVVNPILVLFASMLISMLIIPLMHRIAPYLGMLDQPGERKVHQQPIARVGGIGIVLGAAVPLLLWLHAHPALVWYLFGALVLLVSGAIDDRYNIGHYYKFIGQFIAVVPLVTLGDVYIDRLPLFADMALDPWLGKAITIFSIVGMVNAMNHSDGLDGLAGGEALLTLIAMCFLAYSFLGSVGPTPIAGMDGAVAAGVMVLVLGTASIGGVLGFLRYNTHPARVFMGDTGSQFLGFSVGSIAVLMVTQVDRSMSTAVPLLLLGLPVIDILAVLFLRWRHGMHLFLGSRNHIHHRLLDLGFVHRECVVIIYTVQASFVAGALLLARAPDLLVLATYALAIIIIFASLTRAERKGWRFHRRGEPSKLDALNDRIRGQRILTKGPVWFLATAIPLYLLASSVWIEQVPADFGVMSVLLLVVFLLEMTFSRSEGSTVGRIIVYATAIFIVYLGLENGLATSAGLRLCDQIYFVLVSVAIALALRYARSPAFRLTPMDYLIAFVVLAVGFVSLTDSAYGHLSLLAVKVVIIVYGCEIVMSMRVRRWSAVTVAAVASLGIVSVKGLLLA